MSSGVGAASQLVVGTGRADITGPAAEVPMMGYAKPEQKTAGIHTRLYARTFIFGESANPKQRFVFVVFDACMATQALTIGVLKELEALYGDLYSKENVAISGTHTHSAPGGYSQYVLYQATTLGFIKQSFDALVGGIVQSIVQAHESIKPGRVYVSHGDLLDASINRSPTAYANNPSQERAKYQYNTDKRMTLLKIEEADGTPMGALNWFAVHCTSIGNTNTLISGDNKGIAAQLMEKHFRQEKGHPDFVAAFAQSNEGDVSPNTQGAFCKNTGEACTLDESTCNGRAQDCLGRGPGWPDELKSAEIIGTKQWEKAEELYGSAVEEINGTVDFRHTYLDMSNVVVEEDEFGPAGKTCPPAMGYSFAAGTTDGPGSFDFTQGRTSESPFWRAVSGFVSKPTKEQKECQNPKPILLDTGKMNKPYPWQPAIVDLVLLRVGQIVIACIPGEFTTMSGRRLTETLYKELAPFWGENVQVLVTGLANTYSSYVTTFEEYQIQRYEGASNIFGPHALQAYIQTFKKMARAMIDGERFGPGPTPPDLRDRQLSFLTPVLFDSAFGNKFGAVLKQVRKDSFCHGETVEATFRSANPRNDLRTGDSFLFVEKWNPSQNAWQTFLTDDDLSTKFIWHKSTGLSALSTAKIIWDIREETPEGKYRLSHAGNAKELGFFRRKIKPFKGISKPFLVRRCGAPGRPGMLLPQ
ncbi:hypothetical protein BSKO_06513 [Bryopsis sp. KO-2023]|nr:hypothetical protein BSKO_06513 [Bryopsis sp. KO-2023]